jgi:hypothetical protein
MMTTFSLSYDNLAITMALQGMLKKNKAFTSNGKASLVIAPFAKAVRFATVGPSKLHPFSSSTLCPLKSVSIRSTISTHAAATEVQQDVGLRVDLRGALSLLGPFQLTLLETIIALNAGKKAFIAGVADDQVCPRRKRYFSTWIYGTSSRHLDILFFICRDLDGPSQKLCKRLELKCLLASG